MVAASFQVADSDRAAERNRVNEIRRVARAFLPCSVVDLGSGSGYIGVRLKRDGAPVTIVDIASDRVLDEAKPHFIEADAVEFDLTPFDLIVCAGLLYHLGIDQQMRLAANMRGKRVILDTHFSRFPDANAYEFVGQFRKPTWSTKVEQPFVHTVPSIRKLFSGHFVIEAGDRVTADRQVFLLMPR